jgi:hypothetical protein
MDKRPVEINYERRTAKTKKPLVVWSRRRIWIINALLVALATALVWAFQRMIAAGH